MGQTVTLHTIYGVSKAKTDKALLLEIEENGSKVQSWIPLSVASVKFIGKDFQVKVVVPGWFFRKISWKAPVPYTPKAKSAAPKNPYVGMDYGNMMEEQMVLGEQLSHMEYEYGMAEDSDDESMLKPLASEIESIKLRLSQIREAAELATA